MKTVRQLLQAKQSGVYTIEPDAPVIAALHLMAEHGIGALPVVADGRLAGILSERDYARKIVLQGRSSHDTRVSEIMTARVFCVGPQQTVEECMVLMTEKRIRHLPVLDHKKVVGVISIGDVIKEVISEQKFIIAQLESYIHT